MKFSLVAALLVVLAIGAESAVVKRDVPSEIERITKLIQDMSATISTSAQDMVERVKASELTNQAQTYMEGGRAEILALVRRIQDEAGKLTEQLRPFIGNIEEQMKPLTENLQAQLTPLADTLHAQVKPLADTFQAKMEQVFKQTLEQTKALLPPQ